MRKQRNPVIAGAVGLVLVIGSTLAALHFEDLPLIGGGRSYSAEFTEAAGLKTDDEVRVAGVKVGKVTDMTLKGDRVRVGFRVSDAWLGQRTTASIEIKTLLGQKYLALETHGDQPLDSSKPIPAERTRTPYDVTDAFNGLASTVGEINTAQLAESFQVISDTFRGSPQHVHDALDGLEALSRSVSSRDEQLAKLLSNTSQVSKLAADRNGEFQKLISDGNLLLAEIRARKDSISALLAGTRELSAQLRGVVADNQLSSHRHWRSWIGSPRYWPATRTISRRGCTISRRSCGYSPTPPATARGSTTTCAASCHRRCSPGRSTSTRRAVSHPSRVSREVPDERRCTAS